MFPTPLAVRAAPFALLKHPATTAATGLPPAHDKISQIANSWRRARNPIEWARNSHGLRDRATPAKRDVLDIAVRSRNRNNYRIAHRDARRASTGAATGAGRHGAEKSRSGRAR